ncbi:hypothetical protein K438DRAFT_1755219 [Mycena galopus ATCC 62051]|nr:hypothetical protein K438DRAFT_1755219 [Mycena galopus ATCC 62051]
MATVDVDLGRYRGVGRKAKRAELASVREPDDELPSFTLSRIGVRNGIGANVERETRQPRRLSAKNIRWPEKFSEIGQKSSEDKEEVGIQSRTIKLLPIENRVLCCDQSPKISRKTSVVSGVDDSAGGPEAGQNSVSIPRPARGSTKCEARSSALHFPEFSAQCSLDCRVIQSRPPLRAGVRYFETQCICVPAGTLLNAVERLAIQAPADGIQTNLKFKMKRRAEYLRSIRVRRVGTRVGPGDIAIEITEIRRLTTRLILLAKLLATHTLGLHTVAKEMWLCQPRKPDLQLKNETKQRRLGNRELGRTGNSPQGVAFGTSIPELDGRSNREKIFKLAHWWAYRRHPANSHWARGTFALGLGLSQEYAFGFKAVSRVRLYRDASSVVLAFTDFLAFLVALAAHSPSPPSALSLLRSRPRRPRLPTWRASARRHTPRWSIPRALVLAIRAAADGGERPRQTWYMRMCTGRRRMSRAPGMEAAVLYASSANRRRTPAPANCPRAPQSPASPAYAPPYFYPSRSGSLGCAGPLNVRAAKTKRE